MSLTFQSTFETEVCCTCGVQFAIPASFQASIKRDKTRFYCPNGHGQSYSENEADRLRKQLEREQREGASLKERAIHAEIARDRAEKALTRHKKRAAAGLCPCCNRTVKQLSAHMKSKHSDFMKLQGLGDQKLLAEKVQ